MASAEKVTVQEEQVTLVDVTAVKLELSLAEAEALHCVMGSIGGRGALRGPLSDVWDALNEAFGTTESRLSTLLASERGYHFHGDVRPA